MEQAERLEEPAEEEDLWDITVSGAATFFNFHVRPSTCSSYRKSLAGSFQYAPTLYKIIGALSHVL